MVQSLERDLVQDIRGRVSEWLKVVIGQHLIKALGTLSNVVPIFVTCEDY